MIKKLAVIIICASIYGSGYLLGQRILIQRVSSVVEETHKNTMKVLKEVAEAVDRDKRMQIEYIQTAEIGFSRCKDGNMWCLTTDQYIKLIMQLSGRRCVGE